MSTELNIEKDDIILDFDYAGLIDKVVSESLEYIGCKYEAFVEVTLTDNEGIREINREYRDIDQPTDVLSFPQLEYETPGDLSFLDDEEASLYFDPDSGELLLGDIVINIDRVISQAEEYGHSKERELGFLTAHSMLHLFGFDHMEKEDDEEMQRMQEDILAKLGLTR
ncbi:MAG: rRNA maturation RNase YbeY [Lachnospiraceae bacterium]|nr:rRNA maturation RNase YbeY [Lachnospiraceae bacterium]